MTKWWEPWVLAGPGILLFLIFGFSPIIMALVSSVYEFGPYSLGFVGFTAFKEVLTRPIFWNSLWTTLKFVGILLPTTLFMIISFSVVLSWAGRRIQTFGRFALYLPTVTSVMMISLAWRWILRPDGALNSLLGTEVLWLGSNPWAFWSLNVVALSIAVGGNLLIVMAAFTSVDDELYEAARLDGCSRVQEALFITLPSVLPVLIFVSVTRLVGYLQFWQFPYALTGGGPNYSTTTIMFYAFQEAFVSSRMTNGAVISLFLLLLVVAILLVYRLLSGRKILA